MKRSDSRLFDLQEDKAAEALLRLKLQVGAAAVAVAVFLFASKIAAYFVTGSIGLLGSALDSAADAAASTLIFLAMRYGGRPPDFDHRFGHGKAESIAALVQAVVMVFSAGFLVFQALARLLDPRPIEAGLVGILVCVLAIVVTLGLVAYQRRVLARVQSTAIAADNLQYETDLLLNGAAIAGIGASVYLGFGAADALIGLAIAG
ncbi:MAG: cation diffusion facilitator family transporter, partial [Pseudomonadota bacterium]